MLILITKTTTTKKKSKTKTTEDTRRNKHFCKHQYENIHCRGEAEAWRSIIIRAYCW